MKKEEGFEVETLEKNNLKMTLGDGEVLLVKWVKVFLKTNDVGEIESTESSFLNESLKSLSLEGNV